MTVDLLTEALGAFGAVRTDAAPPTEARSGAGVYSVRTPHGERGYLKATPVGLGTGAMAKAERELRFYQQVAPTTPVATPVLLDILCTSGGIALLLSDVGTERPASAWTDQDWSRLARDLAEVHSMPLPDGDWSRPDPLGTALATPDHDQIRAFWAPVLPALEGLLANRDEIFARLDAQPTAFVHGDCHTGNIVHGERGPAFCDWQPAGLGRASADLAFLSVRATPAGVQVPSALVRDYLAHRPTVADPAELERAALLEELAVYVFEWPPYAAYNDAAGVARVQQRARALADHLGGAATGAVANG
ncbi:phosphotransferase family protein [Promicromonospora vindobonensis]|uniref:Phosphotransferase family protein n=1 Tax=Promicromonospora vindobonensis TaxID=195748 RepID=A0ABW5VVH2_9MICO